MNRNRSAALYEASREVLPGGVNSPVRAFGSVGMPPIFAARAKGSRIVDADGNEYLDYISSWGPMILGHASSIVHQGVEEVFDAGISYGLPTGKELDLARLIRELYPAAEMIRMVNSGTEATMSAIRLARGFTGRDKILKFEGCYHGHYDGLLVKSGSGTLTFNTPTSKGLPKAMIQDTLVAQYNGVHELKDVFANMGDQIAAVILEPVAGNMGVVAPTKEFLQELERLTKENGALLIFDEVITGFRLGLEGAAGLFGMKPDLVCFGKIIGGGLPVGAYGGRREIMEHVSPLGGVYQAGTLSGNPLAMHLGWNLLNHLKADPGIYDRMEDMAKLLEAGLIDAATKAGVEITVNRIGGMLSPFMTVGPVTTFSQVMTSDTQQYEVFFKAMLEEGILLPPSQYEGWFLSASHSREDVQRTIQAAQIAFQQVKEMAK
ncbi:glutamate-1-semialdehyde 2,1-aminomutase [Alkalibacter rhizosphaerae]|uniref:Glutamate-1-semialdehyde 2,1-aminomutase n=1 Tax=Alkalibacter rhizosphaerae TaxID=2815577 RepID=A0A975AHV0_9FIRM|nr:glutamate-1-semialdehyde 2,1-aminomutase [Alkalibacter rhizosphaerae]QSX08827.1 glutamate-1-semialdehyde 2,1-aminomutase [Alkalibacter rhizosphaerae]